MPFGKLNVDGGEYVGEFDKKMLGFKSVRHGNGMQTWPDGKVYDGAWEDGKRHGEGKLTLACGSVYEGDFNDGKVHGKGSYKWPDGTYFQGDYYRGFRQGFGKYYDVPEKYLYDGEFLRDQKHGKGFIQFLDGRHFAGRFHDGQPVQGIYVDYDGTTYDVTFEERGETHLFSSKGLSGVIKEGGGFRTKIKSRVQMDKAKRTEYLHAAREAASAAAPKSNSIPQARRLANETRTERVEILGGGLQAEDSDDEGHFQHYNDWDRFRQQMVDCNLSIKDLKNLFLQSLREATGDSSPASHLRKSASFGGADRRWRATTGAEDDDDDFDKPETDWQRFQRTMSDTGLSLEELSSLYSQSKTSASWDHTGNGNGGYQEDSDDDGRGPEGAHRRHHGGHDSHDWAKFKESMRDTGLSDDKLASLYRQSKAEATGGGGPGADSFASDFDKFQWQMRGCGLSQDELKRLYRQSVADAGGGGGDDSGGGGGGDAGGGGGGKPESDWERFLREMGDTGMSLTDLAKLYRKSRRETSGQKSPQTEDKPRRTASYHPGSSRTAGGGGAATPGGGADRERRRAAGEGSKTSRGAAAAGSAPGAAKADAAKTGGGSASDETKAAAAAAGGGGGGGPSTVEVRMALMNKMMKATSEALDKLAPKLAQLSAAAETSPQALLVHVYQRYPPKREGEVVPVDMGDAAMRKNLLRAIRAYHEDKNPLDMHGLEWHLLCREITKQLNAKLELFK